MTEVEIRKPVALRTIHEVELAAVGTWHGSTGWTTFTNEDFVNAVAALQCPGVRNPVLKLGHAEEDSTSGVRWDGEPAVGWIANMRFDGAKMIGDYTGMPAWLADADENGLSVLAAAYPDRSIEIRRPFVCQIGHTHPSVITAVALLGVMPPGVGVLKSMQDVYAAFTEPIEAESLSGPVTMTVRLAAAEPRGLTEIEQRSAVDFDRVQKHWDDALAALLLAWPDISAAQRDELSAQIEAAVDDNPDGLGDIAVDSAAAALLLLSSMTKLATQSAREQVAEAKRQGVTIPEVIVTDDAVRDVAEAVTAAMAASTASTAGRTAAQALGTGSGADIAAMAIAHLAGLSDRFLRDELGGALSAAQMRGRMAALSDISEPADYYASERNDVNACAPCKSIDGTKFSSLDAAMSVYGGGKYSGCSGGSRCRGQLIAVFGSDRASARIPVRMTTGGPMPTATGGAVRASVSVEDISRKYYESAGYSMWITAMHVDPLELVAADDASGKFFRIPVTLSGDVFEFGEPQEVAVVYQDVAAASAALPYRWGDRKAALLAAGVDDKPAAPAEPEIAPDVTPAGAAIRKMAATATAETPAADSATGPTTTPEEASVDAAKMREALGLGPDASDADVQAAFATALSASPPAAPAPDPAATLTAALPAGEQAMLIDPENYKTLVAMAAKGQTAFEQMQRNERDHVLDGAVKDGRFPVSRLTAYKDMWDRDPAATKAYIELMPKNSVPVMASGFLGAEISQNETDIAYEGVYGKVGA